MSNNGNCPFCQTEIKSGAVVCTGCQANYRNAGWTFGNLAIGFIGAMFALQGIFGVMRGDTLGAIIGFIIGAAIIFFAGKRAYTTKWFRVMH